MVLETSNFVTIFWDPRCYRRSTKYRWVTCTWFGERNHPYSLSKCHPGDLRRFLRHEFGSTAVGSKFPPFNKSLIIVLVDGELWTDETVFWQNKLIDRGQYEVVYRSHPFNTSSNFPGKPWVFQLWQIFIDRRDGVKWDSEVPHATKVSPDEPPKIKIIQGPSRISHEEHLPWQYGTNWGRHDPRTGRAWKDLTPEERKFGLPPAYSER